MCVGMLLTKKMQRKWEIFLQKMFKKKEYEPSLFGTVLVSTGVVVVCSCSCCSCCSWTDVVLVLLSSELMLLVIFFWGLLWLLLRFYAVVVVGFLQKMWGVVVDFFDLKKIILLWNVCAFSVCDFEPFLYVRCMDALLRYNIIVVVVVVVDWLTDWFDWLLSFGLLLLEKGNRIGLFSNNNMKWWWWLGVCFEFFSFPREQTTTVQHNRRPRWLGTWAQKTFCVGGGTPRYVCARVWIGRVLIPPPSVAKMHPKRKKSLQQGRMQQHTRRKFLPMVNAWLLLTNVDWIVWVTPDVDMVGVRRLGGKDLSHAHRESTGEHNEQRPRYSSSEKSFCTEADSQFPSLPSTSR